MRSRITIFIFSFVIIFAMASNRASFFSSEKNDADTVVSVKDTVRKDSAIAGKVDI